MFLEIKQNQLRSVITHPKYVTWLTICIDLITKVKSLRRKLNLFQHILCFAFLKKCRIYTSHFFANLKIASQNAKWEALIQTLYHNKEYDYFRFNKRETDVSGICSCEKWYIKIRRGFINFFDLSIYIGLVILN